MVERFGRLSMAEVLAPALHLAENGFPVVPLTAYQWQRGVETHLSEAVNGVEMTLDGRAPRAGEIFRNPGLARALEQVARGGKRAFYEGPIAESISAVVQEAGGCLMQTDLAAHESTWVEPIRVTYRDLHIWECPPNGQGLTALLALNLLNGFDLADLPPLSAGRLHLQIEALRLAFMDTSHYVADPAFQPAPLSALLSPEYAEQRRKLIDPRRAIPQLAVGEPSRSSDTVYFSVVDREGNACSFINSNSMDFGTGIVPRGWGFCLQNRGSNFRLQPGHPNVLEPGKRPYHTIIPALATRAKDDSLSPVLASWVVLCSRRVMYRWWLGWPMTGWIPNPRSIARVFIFNQAVNSRALQWKKVFPSRRSLPWRIWAIRCSRSAASAV